MKFYRRHERSFGYAVPLIATAIFIVLVEWVWGEARYVSWLATDRGLVYSTLAAVAGAILGFVITAVTVMIAIIDRPRLQAISNSRPFPVLFLTWFEAIYVLGLTILASFIALLAETDQSPKPWLSFLVLALALVSASKVLRTIRLLKAVCLLAIKPIPAPPVDARPPARGSSSAA